MSRVAPGLAVLVLLATPATRGACESQPAPAGSAKALLADPVELASWLAGHDLDVRAARARLGQAGADLAQSRLLPNPALNLQLSDVSVGATNPPGLRLSDTAIYGATLSETVELGKRGPRIASARLRLGSGHEAYLDALADAVGQARLALGRVAYLGSRQAALEESLGAARQVLDLQRSRFDHGDLSGNDYDRLVLDAMVLESDVTQNRADYRAALGACQAALYAPCDPEGLDLAALDAAAEVAVPPEWESALDRRPDLRALGLLEQAARQDAIVARRRAIPDPSLSLGYTRDKLTISGDQPRTLLFGVTLPLPLADRGQHDAARAELRAEEQHESAAALRQRARTEIAALIERKASLESTLAGLREQALPRSKGVLDSTVAAVGQGELSMTDLLLAQRTRNDLVLKVMDLEWSAFSARNDLRQALGADAELAREVEGPEWKAR